MDRRAFLIAAAAAVASCSRDRNPEETSSADGLSGPAGGEAARPLGVQLYTVRDLMAIDVAATLDLVASAGFELVEFAGYFDRSPTEWRRLLAASGVTPVSAHVGKAQFLEDADRVIEHAAEMGHEYLVIPSVPDTERSTLDDYRRHADDFNRWGEASATAGIQFAYHNHMFEFDETEGQIPYELLLNETDPYLVQMELDFCWAQGAGADASAYFDAWPGRFTLCHLKDFADGRDADIGSGSVDFDALLSRASSTGLKHGFVERDHPEDSAKSIRTGYAAILETWNRYMAAI